MMSTAGQHYLLFSFPAWVCSTSPWVSELVWVFSRVCIPGMPLYAGWSYSTQSHQLSAVVCDAPSHYSRGSTSIIKCPVQQQEQEQVQEQEQEPLHKTKNSRRFTRLSDYSVPTCSSPGLGQCVRCTLSELHQTDSGVPIMSGMHCLTYGTTPTAATGEEKIPSDMQFNENDTLAERKWYIEWNIKRQRRQKK